MKSLLVDIIDYQRGIGALVQEVRGALLWLGHP